MKNRRMDTDVIIGVQTSQLISESPEDVVIAGISGSFPGSKNLVDLEQNLRNEVNLIGEPNAESSYAIGRIPNANKFDASYFGITPDYADAMDPMGRILLEKTYEAIIDSGYNPETLRGKKVGVYVGVYLSESEIAYFSSGTSEGLAITGITRSFLANRISYSFGFHGPSFCIDTACSSALHALQLAYKAIKSDECESAIVGGCNLCLNNAITATLLKLGVLSPEGKARVLDERSVGYCRAETVCSIFLQKRKNARRIHAHVVHAKVNCDGYKAEGITYPSHIMQKQLLREFYDECGVPPESVDWIELHATGTRAGDREEIKAVEMFCENRVTPLKVGSVKSNMGHAEAASALSAIAKAIIAMRSAAIPPNINYQTPRTDIDALHNGLIEVITKNTPWDGGLVGLNSFGLGGANGHALLKSYDKTTKFQRTDTLSRLVTASGRTEEAVETILTAVQSKDDSVDVELISLLHEIHSDDIVRHLYRGYTILHEDRNKIPEQQIVNCTTLKRPIWFLFAGMGSQWPGMGTSLMSIPIFAQSIQQCHKILKTKNMDLIRIITVDESNVYDDALNAFVAITAMQIGLIDLLRAINVVPNGILGHSAGEIACGYADKCLTLEQTILCAYYRGLAVYETNTIQGSMATVGLSFDELGARIPSQVDIACRNGSNNCTISGPGHRVKQFVDQLREEQIFVREVKSANIAFHSRYIRNVGPVLQKYLKTVIPEPKLRSAKWITTSAKVSTTTTTDDTQTEDIEYCSAGYQTNNLLNPVLFEDAVKQIPENAIVVEVSPHAALGAITKPSLKSQTVYVSLAAKNCIDSVEYLLQALGQIFLAGKSMRLQNLYPAVRYPVSYSTPTLAPLVRWQHTVDWRMVYASKEEMVPGERRITVYPKGKEHNYMLGHVIDGRNIFPGFGYVQLIWETVAIINGKNVSDCSVVFEKLQFRRIINISRDGEHYSLCSINGSFIPLANVRKGNPASENLHFIIHVQKGSGNFEITENGLIVMTGKVRVPDDDDKDLTWESNSDGTDDDDTRLSTEDIYQELALRGYGYTGLHKQLLSCNDSGTRARARWNENWPTFLDSMAQVYVFQSDTRDPHLLSRIDKLVVNVNRHREYLQDLDQNSGLLINVYKKFDIVESGGVRMKGIRGHITTRRKLQKEPQLLTHKFAPFIEPHTVINSMEFSCFCAYMLWQNILSTSVKMVEYSRDNKEFISADICESLNAYPHIQPFSTIITDRPIPQSQQDKPYLKFQEGPAEESDVHLVIIDSLDERTLENGQQMLADDGFILVRSKATETMSFTNLTICAHKILENEKLILLRRIKPINEDETICVKVSPGFGWIRQLQKEINSHKRIILYAERDSISGILGFYNCLRKETSNNRIRCFFIVDQNTPPPFSLAEPSYRAQIAKNLSVNVLRDNKWGCYVHYALPEIPLTRTPHAFVKVGRTGDLRTLNWYRGNVNPSTNNDVHESATTKLIHVYYSAINFKDVLLATGALPYDEFTRNRITQECLIGCEFSGRDHEGKRYMGMHPAGAISTVVLASKLFLWETPENWSLEDAATVPVVYLTVISAFFVHGNMKKGETVLIHSGAGGVGQAAINIALHHECTVFTTVGTSEKREFIKKQFPQITDSHIGNSRDTTFEYMILKETQGKGVDLVLNSLAEDKLQASIRCLAKGGRFLEIGKLDLLKDNNLGMGIFLRGISFHCILLDRIHEEVETKRDVLLSRFQHELYDGSIKPIVRNVFKDDELEDAFRFMATGKHVGKVLIKIRSADSESQTERPTNMLKEAIPRFICAPEKVYIICGGVGGMGIELADWLVLRGARTLILTSRNDNTTSYQKMRIRLWNSYGVTTTISTADLSNRDEVLNLLTSAESIGPVGAIFNLAGITEDKLFENLNPEDFEYVSTPKTKATLFLDRISRKVCPKLEHFVVFSSVSCGYGNTAQTNYGLANSVCERICERRREQGFPALAIQWGCVDEVGMMKNVTNTEKSFGLKKQPIRSCLLVMDTFLNQSEVIVTSFIAADKNTDYHTSASLVESIANILGIKNLKSISMYSPLPELGMDSINGLEIKNTLEQQHDIFLSPKEIMTLTFAQLEEIQKGGKKALGWRKNDNNCTTSIPYIKKKLLSDSKSINFSNMEPIVELPSLVTISTELNEKMVFFFPATDGIAASMESLASRLNAKVMCFQYHNDTLTEPFENQAQFYASFIRHMIPSEEEFFIVAYSYGVILAMEVMKILCSENRKGKAVLIDGSLEFAQSLQHLYFGNSTDLEDIQRKVILDVIQCFLSSVDTAQLEKQLEKTQNTQNWEAKLDVALSKIPNNASHDKHNLQIIMNFLYHKYRTLTEYHFHLDEKLNVNGIILQAKKVVFPVPVKMGLKENFVSCPMEYLIDENHFTILGNEKTADIINSIINRKHR